YSALAYAGANPLSLGSSPGLPSLNFEVRGIAAGAVTETYAIASPYNFTPTNFTLASSVIERATVPATAPYQIQAQNPTAQTEVLVARGGPITGSSIPGSKSQGIVDANGRVFTRVSASPATGQYIITKNASGWVYMFAAADAGLAVTIVDLAVAPGVLSAGTVFEQVLAAPGAGQFSVSVQPGTFGQYQFAAADAGKSVVITDVPDADPVAVLTDYLTNGRYGCGLPSANIGDLAALQNYAFANGLFISPALVTSRAANDFLNDFGTGLNGEFVWSGGLLTFVPYGDATIAGFGKTYSPPAAPIYTLGDDDFLKNEGGAGAGISAFSGDDPVICVRARPSDAYNDVKIEYLDRGNSYNPAIAEAQDDASINAYGLRPADRKQLHFFCALEPALVSAQLQLARQQARNLYTFTVPWYFVLLEPMDIVAITDAALGLDGQWVRIREITENQQDGSLTIAAEEYVPGAGTAPIPGGQPNIGYTPNV
ncbi:MAG: phage tail protein, partial [Stellaceae bacterium]